MDQEPTSSTGGGGGDGETLFKRATAALFYRLIAGLSEVPSPATPATFGWSIGRSSTSSSGCRSDTASSAG